MILQQMIEYRRLAAHAHCRITAWKLNEYNAFRLADELRPMGLEMESPWEMVERMKQGLCQIFGATIIVR